MTERCVFTDINFQQASIPFYRGFNGECFARPGNEMNDCCFQAAQRLILLGNNNIVLKAAESLTGKAKSQTSRLHGLTGALNEHA